ncbi:MAG: transcriptional regulator [Anaerostipes sp.]|nr:transcriptional regulator [Anaerostipes sp.]MDD3747493.1 transcriptional regulator [Anaerostipes sp.]MDD4371274.1 transcriptional regulator [Anaerostipes sp.]
MVQEFYKVKDISKIMQCCTSKAYAICKQLNTELEEQGFIIIHGRVPKNYFNDRVGLTNDKREVTE